MTSDFCFRWRPENAATRSILVVFSIAAFTPATFSTLLDEDYRANLKPDGLIVVVPSFRAKEYEIGLRSLAQDGSVLRFDPKDAPIGVVAFEQDGRPKAVVIVAGDKISLPEDFFTPLKRAGLLEVFRKREVVVRPGPALHFVHPSGIHSAGFLRAANALVRGAEVGFIAMTLLPYLAFNPKRIWIDSSSIASVAYAMISLRQSMSTGYSPPPIESFSSYDRLESTVFEHANSSLFLISATASGQLARKLMGLHSLRRERIVNLFSAVSGDGQIEILCDVSTEVNSKESGLSIVQTFAAGDCPLCREGSQLIRFVGDQFLANAIIYTPVLIVAGDAPQTLARSMESLARRHLFKLQANSAEPDTHRFWIDVETLINVEAFKDRVSRTARRYVPASVSHVVHLPDQGSQAFGQLLAELIKDQSGSLPKIVKSSGLSTISASEVKSVVIASGCVGSGNSLQAVSRDLRDLFKDNPRIYIGALAKYYEEKRHKYFKSDLEYNRDGYKHEAIFLEQLSLPRETSLSAWAKETDLLNQIADSDDVNSLSVNEQEYFNSRIEILNQKEIKRDDFFLPDGRGDKLKLRDGFAFWSKGATIEDVDQGDVLATIASLLQHMRTHSGKGNAEPKLSHTEFRCSVLSPGVFGRYNDGVIQAAFLRLALPHELNYGARPDLSVEMSRIIERCLERFEDTQGEACAEFLLALATRRLTLQPTDINKLSLSPAGVRLTAPLKLLFRKATEVN